MKRLVIALWLSVVLSVMVFIPAFTAYAQSDEVKTPLTVGPVEQINDYYSTQTITYGDGTSLTGHIINGPPEPPPGFEVERQEVALPEPNPAMGTNTLTVPAFKWVFGCASVSGAMIAGYYDRNGYPSMYTGPTNGGVMPLDSSSWGTWSDGYATYANVPLAASHNGVDGRVTKGSIDDYWIKYNSCASDPYITGAWTQHTWGDAIGDYMKTSQSAYGNCDGSTTFWNWSSSAAQFTCATMASTADGSGHMISWSDGTYGRKLFYEAKGYTVTDCYSQKTDNTITGGFSFAQLKAEIDAGRPVMLNLDGHTIVAVGYNDPSTVYVHDTWDYVNHNMTWGGSYSGMQLLSVSIVHLASNIDSTPDPFIFDYQTGVARGIWITSNKIKVSGINVAVPISITGGRYSVNGTGYITKSRTVKNGATITVQVLSSSSFCTKKEATLTIGGVSDTFSVTTKACRNCRPCF